MRSSWITWVGLGLNPMTIVLVRARREDTDTQQRKPCEDGGRDWRDAATSQGMPAATRSWKRQGRILP